MHWQVRGWDDSVQYFDPRQWQIEMVGCKLINKKNAARKVYNAGRKDVCGWVECDKYHISPASDEAYPVDNLERLRYNPIVDPVWRREDDDGDFDWDNCHFDSLVTNGNRVYVLEERCYA
jgi:hypothetical protein